ncbi:MAG TPA: alpha/beta fold hydrolase [Steroidobacteraceae bacterium]|nr:alpha/beta fold hydrolase [Steroidobacteraceae bacterium]
MTSSAAPFSPPRWFANAHVQSILPSLRVRKPIIRRRAKHLLECTQTRILDCGDGVRLIGQFSQHASSAGERDAVVLLHGWEGSADSLYVLSLGAHLFALGCDVVRLNFRDHGASHHLNKELFHSCRLDEVVGAVLTIQHMLPKSRLSLAGFSLGGNFALRVAAKAREVGLTIERAVAVCPVLRPHTTMDAIESGSFVYRQYFLAKWKRSLRLKQALFPELYDFKHILAQRSIRTMTQVMVEKYSEFADIDAYLNGYAITGDALAKLDVPSHLLLSLDDPLIPAADLQHLARNPHLHIETVPHGGHCGFMDRFSTESWADRYIGELMRNAPLNAQSAQPFPAATAQSAG